ncbi:MAG: arginine--tRNA ligase [Holosporales bacterium]|jgi:arginyl-tRNA synthetase|nr:arginine--tRNA ligase [Holosporales bacterium]
MFQVIRDCILRAVKKISNANDAKISEDDIIVEPPKDKAFGDIYTNAAMSFAKKLQVSPKTLAEAICEELLKNQDVTEANIAGPGFVNVKLRNSAWQKIINEIITKKDAYSYANLNKGSSVNVEFVSANPTGPLHTGHARNAVFGSVVANLLEKIGYKVTREFFINDQGNQIKSLARSIYLRYQELMGTTIPDDAFTEDMYCGEYIKDLAKELIDTHGNKFLNKNESEWLDLICKFAIERVMRNVKNDLSLLGIVMDEYVSEAELCRKKLVEEALEILTDNGDIYEGVLPRPKGITDKDEWEERPQTLFKSTKYGDDIDRAIRKSDGTWTYFAGDLAYHLDKIKRGYKKIVTILGADHNGYVKRLKAAVKALSQGKTEIEIRLYQLVNFLENGVPVKMSKRAGNFITLREVVERVGKDVARYMMISRHHDVAIDFDFVKAVEFSMDNPIFYIQYAYARICSVFKRYESVFGKLDEKEFLNCDKSTLSDEAEISLIKALAFWPEQVKSAASALEPHRIPNYMQNIAHLFHALWNKGKIDTELRFIDRKSRECTIIRLSLLQAVKTVLEDGFKIMGVTPMSEMV